MGLLIKYLKSMWLLKMIFVHTPILHFYYLLYFFSALDFKLSFFPSYSYLYKWLIPICFFYFLRLYIIFWYKLWSPLPLRNEVERMPASNEAAGVRFPAESVNFNPKLGASCVIFVYTLLCCYWRKPYILMYPEWRRPTLLLLLCLLGYIIMVKWSI